MISRICMRVLDMYESRFCGVIIQISVIFHFFWRVIIQRWRILVLRAVIIDTCCGYHHVGHGFHHSCHGYHLYPSGYHDADIEGFVVFPWFFLVTTIQDAEESGKSFLRERDTNILLFTLEVLKNWVLVLAIRTTKPVGNSKSSVTNWFLVAKSSAKLHWLSDSCPRMGHFYPVSKRSIPHFKESIRKQKVL